MTQAPSFKSLGVIKRKSVDLSEFTPVKTGFLADSQSMPLVMQPAAEHVDLAEWAQNNRERIGTDLSKYGAILFRGFNLTAPSDFEKVASAICGELFGEYGDLPREGVAGKVYTSTPYPPDKRILFHNESSHLHRWPMKISFFCVKAAEQGGATPIVDCREVCRRLEPKVLTKFADKGVMYIRNFSEGLDVNWRRFFHTEDKTVVETSCRNAGMTCEWTPGDGLRIRQICQAVARHPKTGEETFFNQVQLHHISCLEPAVRQSLLSLFKEEDLPRNVCYGDGSPIEDAVMEHVGEVYEKTAVRFQWQPGDMVMLDNMITAHARDTYVGERKIVVAMAEMVSMAQMESSTAAGAPV